MMFNNGNFECDWGNSHACLVLYPDGTKNTLNIGNIFTPKDWITWFYHDPGKFDQPEVRDAWGSVDPRRVHSGKKGTLLFTFYRKHNAGFLQSVQAEKGGTYKLTAWAHAWSNSKDGPHVDDAYWSEGPGRDAGFILEGEAPNDDWRNFTFYLGIDPTGGTNPMAGTVVWGRGAHIYNKYAQVPEVKVVAASDTITVFLRSVTKWPFKHNDAYWDDAELVKVSGGGDPGSGEWYPPRVQYERTYILLPPMDENTAMLWRAAAGIGSSKNLVTVGHSADDAGIGPKDRTVLAVNPVVWTGNADELKDFFNKHYPNITYTPMLAGTPWELAIKVAPPQVGTINMGQTWEEWAGMDFGEHPGGGTIRSYGCLLTGLGMILSKVYDREITPPLLDKLLILSKAAYTDDNILLWENAIDLFPIFDNVIKDNNYRNSTQLKELLDKNWEVILRRSDGAHFVYLTKVDGNNLHIIDPWDGKDKVVYASNYAGIRAAHVAGTTPPDDPPPDDPPPTPYVRKTRGHVGLHLQGNASGVTEFVRDVKPSIMKCATGFERVIDIKKQSINTTCIIRHVNNNYGGILDNPNPLVGARNWVNQFKDSLYNICDKMAKEIPGIKAPYFYVESVNEVMPSLNAEAVNRANNLDIGFIDALAELNLPVAPAVFCVAVGNPHETEFILNVPLARKCEKAGGMMGYHNYWPRNPSAGGPDALWKYLSGRWVEMDKVLVANGVHVRWYGGEGGAVGGTWDEGHVHLMPYNGWKSKECMNGNRDLYLTEIMRADELAREWNKTHGDRFLGFVLFTTSGPGWGNFDIGAAEIPAIGTRLMQRYPTI